MLMWFGGWRHCGLQGQQGEEDQGSGWHYDVSLQLKCSSTWMWYAVVRVVDVTFFCISNMWDNLQVMCVEGRWHCGWQRQFDGGDCWGWCFVECPVAFSMSAGEWYVVLIVGTLKCLTASICVTTQRFMTPSRWRRRQWTPAGRSERPITLTEIIHTLTSMVSSSWLSLPSTVSMTTKTHDLNVVTNVEDVNNCHSNQFYHNISNTSWRKMQSKWYIILSATSLVFSSRLSLPSTLS